MVVATTTEVVREERSEASEERTALTEDADAEGERVVVESVERKVMVGEAVREMALLEETAALDEMTLLEELPPTEKEEESEDSEP